jgi:hypothetical protein
MQLASAHADMAAMVSLPSLFFADVYGLLIDKKY